MVAVRWGGVGGVVVVGGGGMFVLCVCVRACVRFFPAVR